MTQLQLVNIIQDVCPEVDLQETDNLIDQIDSLDLVLLVDEIEAKFGVKFAPSDISHENFKTVATLDNLIRNYGRGI